MHPNGTVGVHYVGLNASAVLQSGNMRSKVQQSLKLLKSHESPEFKFNFTCTRILSHGHLDGSLLRLTTLQSNCTGGSDRHDLRRLGAQVVQCGQGHVLQAFGLSTGCSTPDLANGMRYTYQCVALPAYMHGRTPTVRHSGCTNMAGTSGLHWLERQHVKCDRDESMASFRLTENGCGEFENGEKGMQYEISCINNKA